MNNITYLPLSKETPVCIRVAGQIFMVSSALNLAFEITRGVRSFFRLTPTVSALALGILGCDLFKIGCNLQEFYDTKKFIQHATLGVFGNTDTKELAKAIFRDTILERLYYDIATLVTKDFTMIKVYLN